MNSLSRIKNFLASCNDDVFPRSDFDPFGAPSQVGQGLRRPICEGRLVRLGLRIYAKAKPSMLIGPPIPLRPLEVLAPAALSKLGIAVVPSHLTREYNVGRTTQLPAGIVLNVGRHRVAPKLSLNGKVVRYEYE